MKKFNRSFIKLILFGIGFTVLSGCAHQKSALDYQEEPSLYSALVDFYHGPLNHLGIFACGVWHTWQISPEVFHEVTEKSCAEPLICAISAAGERTASIPQANAILMTAESSAIT